MRVLVCGGRDYSDSETLDRVLDKIHAETPITFLIEGGARGADYLACVWSAKRAVEGHRRFTADWAIHGKSAGPIRNKQMLVEGKPDLVVAFPGKQGTANMIEQAERAGVRVIKIEK